MQSMLLLTDEEKDAAVKNFQEFLRINTAHPDPDYDGAVRWLCAKAKELDLPCDTIEVYPGKPVVVMTWLGQDPSLRSLMLHCHTDVVPAHPDEWKYDPFSATIDENGDIFARGAQDMKCVGVQYIEAVRLFRQQNYQPKRTVYLTFVPDEEIMGELGMKKFIEHEFFKKMNVGCSLDEGLPNTTDKFTVYYGERSVMWMKITAKGDPSLAYRQLGNTALEKIYKVIEKASTFRSSEIARLNREKKLTLGDVTTVNVTKMSGGLQTNMIPGELTIHIDCRVAHAVDLPKMEQELQSWCDAAGPDVFLEFIHKFNSHDYITEFSNSNPWWRAFSSAADSLGLQLIHEIFPFVTNSRYLRAIGIDAIGFSPINRTPVKQLDHNEFLNKDVFLKGVEYYTVLISAVADAETN